MLHQSAFLLALRNASPGTECASPTSVPHFLVDRPFAVVWLYFSWLPRWRDSFRALGGSLFGVPSTDRGSRLRDMSNFCCLPGRAGGTPLLVSRAAQEHRGLLPVQFFIQEILGARDIAQPLNHR